MRKTTPEIQKSSYIFEKDKKGYPKNIFNCQFFKTQDQVDKDPDFTSRIAMGDSALDLVRSTKERVYCSIRRQILEDYRICCTKHEGTSPDAYLHCLSYLERLGNMSDKERLRLRELHLMSESTRTAQKAAISSAKSARASTIAAWVAVVALIITIIFEIIKITKTGGR